MSELSKCAVEVLLTARAEAQPIQNLFPLYLHDIASYEHKPPNRHGVLADDDRMRTWDELLEGQAAWWEKPGVLFPYLINATSLPAGFLFIASGPYVPTPSSDFVVHEFFIAHAWRGSGVAAEAIRQGCARHRGRWEVATWPKASRALAFWRKTLPTCASGAVRETEEDHPWGRRVVFRFDNRGV
ncbi:MAG: GNAT family N-acetyltransferase [Planctomycetota bacterium]